MSHEIRTPLNGIIGFTNLMLEKCDNAQNREYLNYISNSGNTLLFLLNDILDFNKMEYGKLSIEEVSFNFRDMVSKWVAPYHIQAKEKKILFEVVIDNAIPNLISGDPHRTQQVLVNYVSNAFKFTESGKVLVNISMEKNVGKDLTLNFTISDSGIGVPADKQELIFDLFTQADSSTTRKFGGTGLGLAINRQLAHLMGGNTGIISPGYFKDQFGTPGSDFWFNINVKEGKAADNPENANVSAIHLKFEKSPNLLVAEDNPINQLLIKKVLDTMNCNVTVVENGKLAIEQLEKNTFDAVLLDIQMPVMDGYQTTHFIRASSSYNQVPVIGISANVYQEDIAKSLDSGMNAHICKPFKKDELYNVLNKLINEQIVPITSGQDEI